MIRSSLSRHQARPKTPEWELDEFRRKAWLHDRIACIRVDALNDDWERQIVTNIANRLFGQTTGETK